MSLFSIVMLVYRRLNHQPTRGNRVTLLIWIWPWTPHQMPSFFLYNSASFVLRVDESPGRLFIQTCIEMLHMYVCIYIYIYSIYTTLYIYNQPFSLSFSVLSLYLSLFFLFLFLVLFLLSFSVIFLFMFLFLLFFPCLLLHTSEILWGAKGNAINMLDPMHYKYYKYSKYYKDCKY